MTQDGKDEMSGLSELLKVRVTEKRFGDRTVLSNVEFGVAAGQVVALVGPSGCGKSTLLRIIAGLEQAYEGEVVLDGRRLAGLSRDIGFIFQEPRLFPWLSVAQNVAFGSGRDDADLAQAAALLAEVGLSGYEEALPKQLSGGQAQRVAIARGLFTRPRFLLLDEPFSAVDAFTRMRLQELLLGIAAQHGITVLLVTHDVDEAAYLSNRVLVLGNGRIVDDILTDPAVPPPRQRDRRSPSLQQARNAILESLEGLHVI
jgi:sulfonate transport system ATP-binding protein